jgi:hypothetical protein
VVTVIVTKNVAGATLRVVMTIVAANPAAASTAAALGMTMTGVAMEADETIVTAVAALIDMRAAADVTKAMPAAAAASVAETVATEVTGVNTTTAQVLANVVPTPQLLGRRPLVTTLVAETTLVMIVTPAGKRTDANEAQQRHCLHLPQTVEPRDPRQSFRFPPCICTMHPPSLGHKSVTLLFRIRLMVDFIRRSGITVIV